MQIILEKAELIALLCKGLGYPIKDQDITIQAEPFEVHIQNVDLSKVGKSEDPPEDSEPQEEKEESHLSMDELLNRSKKLETEDRPDRPLGPGESYDAPDEVTEDEVNAGRR